MNHVIRQGRRIEVITLDADVSAKPKGRAHAPFVKLPMSWAKQLATQRSGAAWVVAVRLLHLGWKNGGHPIVLGNVALRELGIGRKRKGRGLAVLERLGLISVERRLRCAPRITLHK